jgi:hypothetical protein
MNAQRLSTARNREERALVGKVTGFPRFLIRDLEGGRFGPLPIVAEPQSPSGHPVVRLRDYSSAPTYVQDRKEQRRITVAPRLRRGCLDAVEHRRRGKQVDPKNQLAAVCASMAVDQVLEWSMKFGS